MIKPSLELGWLCKDKTLSYPLVIFENRLNKIIVSWHKWISNSSNDRQKTKSRKYKCGFHILPKFEETKDILLKQFKNLHNKAIVKCKAKNVWPKKHSPNNIYLAEWIYI